MTDQHVVVYTSDDCTQCRKLINKLNEWSVPYEEKNISRNHSFVKELQERKVYGAPAVFINERKILGFQEYKLKKELGLTEDYTFRFKSNSAAYNISGQQ